MFFGGTSPADEPYYEAIGLEITSGNLRLGLWARCMADAKFDENRAKTNYIKQRFKELKHDLALQNAHKTVVEAGLRIEQLDQQEAEVSPTLRQSTMLIFIGAFFGTLGGLLIGSCVAAFSEHMDYMVLPDMAIGGFLGFIVTVFLTLCMPSQREASRVAAGILNERRSVMARFNEAEKTIRRLCR